MPTQHLVTVLDATPPERAAQVHGVLIISNAPPDRPVPDSGSGPPALVVTWDPDDNDGVLGRALVRLSG